MSLKKHRMEEAYEEAVKELKRVDHIFYVSLKYTRTADMMKHMLDRLINTFQFGILSLLRKAKEEKDIDEVPDNVGLQAKLALETFKEQEVQDYIHFYLKLRKVNRATFTKREEYRRHVTMTVALDNGEVVEVNIDSLKENYELAKEFLRYVKTTIRGEEDI